MGASWLPHGGPFAAPHRCIATAVLSNSQGSTDSSVFSSRKATRSGRAQDATFLTECSFAVSYDALVRAIADVHRYEPDWRVMTYCDLSSKGLDSLARLKEFLPALQEARL
jgi:hypothetical protein